MHGYDVFFDYQSIDSGNFEGVILDNIRARAHFIVILTPSALEKCKEPEDWLRREIETAIDENRNIIPFMVENFDFGNQSVKDALTGKLSRLNTYNGLPVPSAYVFESMERLRERFLNKALSDIPKANLQPEAKRITEMQKVAASKAKPVDIEKEIANTPIEALGLSTSTFDTLSQYGITKIGDVLNLLGPDKSALASIRKFGEASLDVLRQKMQEKGYLKDD